LETLIINHITNYHRLPMSVCRLGQRDASTETVADVAESAGS